MADYEFFKKEFEFRGKHARMVSELWISNDYNHTYFRRLIDLYLMAAIIGFRVDRRADIDYSPIETKSIFPEQMVKAKEDLDFIMQMMIMLDKRSNMSNDECVKEAFRGAESKEEFERLQNMFDSYVRGGVEELHERFIIRRANDDSKYYDAKTASIMELMEEFSPHEELENMLEE